jgi:MFS family permease
VLPILPLHLSHLGYSIAEIGVLISSLSLTMGAIELYAGPIVGVFGRRWTLIGGYSANAVCLVLAGMARTTGMVGSALAAIGAARAILVPPLHATVAESSTAATRGKMFGMYWLWASTATLVGPAIGGFIAAKYGDRAPFYVGSAFSIVALPIVAAVAAPKSTSPRAPMSEVMELLGNAAIVRLCIATLLCFSITGIWTTFLPLYIARQGISVLIVGSVFTVQGLFYALMQIPAGRLVHHMRGGWLALSGIMGIAGVVLLIPRVHAPSVFLVAGAVYGAAFGSIPVTFATLVTWLAPRDKYTTAMGVYNSAIDFGLFVGPLLGGVVAYMNTLAPFLLALPLGVAAVSVSLNVVGSAPRRG